MRISETDFGGRLRLDAYGGGGFRISGVFHAGSILLLPTGPRSWAPQGMDELDLAAFGPVLAERRAFEILLLGTGARFALLAPKLRLSLQENGLAVDAMDTGAACRSFNVLTAEGRRVAAALLAVQ